MTSDVTETSEPPANGGGTTPPPKMLTLQIDDPIDAAIERERTSGGRILSRSEAARRLMRRGAGLAVEAATNDAGPPS